MSAPKPDKQTLEKHDVEKHSRPWYLKLHLPHRSRDSSTNRRTSKSTSPARPIVRLDFTKNIPTNIPYPPFVNVEGVPNFRDVGGYRCPRPEQHVVIHSASPEGDNAVVGVDGAVDALLPPQDFSVRRAYVFRCSELSQITAKGLKTLTQDLNIRRLYDFRSEREAADPRGQPKGVECISTPVFRKDDVTHQMAVQQLTWSTAPDTPAGAGFSQGYVDWYRQILVYGGLYAYRIVFEHIRDRPDEPLLYHCTAGKDRTGVLSALILRLCGVDIETAAWEYSLTVPGMGVWEEAVEQEMVGDSMMPIRSHGGMTREEARRICGSRASNMEQFLKAVLDAEFGGAAKYLKDHLGFPDAEIEVIRSHLVVPGEATVKPVSFPALDEHAQT